MRYGAIGVAALGVTMLTIGPEARGGPIFRKVADTSTAIPGGAGTYSGFGTDFNQPSISGSNVAFLGTGAGGQAGIYADFGAGPVRVADTSTAIPALRPRPGDPGCPRAPAVRAAGRRWATGCRWGPGTGTPAGQRCARNPPGRSRAS